MQPAAPRACAAVDNSSPQGAILCVGPLQASTGTSPWFEIVHQRDFDLVGIFAFAHFVGEHVQPGAGASNQHQVFVERTDERLHRLVHQAENVHDIREYGGTQVAKLIGVERVHFLNDFVTRSRMMITPPRASNARPLHTSHVRIFSTLVRTSSFTLAT